MFQQTSHAVLLWLKSALLFSPLPCPFRRLLQMGGKLVFVGLLGAGAWAANEYGYINFKQAAGNLPLPHLVSGRGSLGGGLVGVGWDAFRT
jgi:hypothetical protein